MGVGIQWQRFRAARKIVYVCECALFRVRSFKFLKVGQDVFETFFAVLSKCEIRICNPP